MGAKNTKVPLSSHPLPPYLAVPHLRCLCRLFPCRLHHHPCRSSIFQKSAARADAGSPQRLQSRSVLLDGCQVGQQEIANTARMRMFTEQSEPVEGDDLSVGGDLEG